MKQGRTKEPQSYRLSSSSGHDESGVDGGDDCGGCGDDDGDGGDANWEWHLSMLHPYSPCWKKRSCRNQGCIGWSFFRERSGVKS